MAEHDVRVGVGHRLPLFAKGVASALSRVPTLGVVILKAEHANLIELCQDHNPSVLVLDSGFGTSDADLATVRGAGVCVVLIEAMDPCRCRRLLEEERVSRVVPIDIKSSRLRAIVLALGGGLRDTQPVERRSPSSLYCASAPALTTREAEVLCCAATGASVSDIAARLCLGGATVKTHLGRSYYKLGVRNRSAAIATALRLGIID